MTHTVRVRKEAAKTLHRGFSIDAAQRAGADDEARTIEASISSDTPVRDWFGREVLQHTAEAVNLSRAEHGLPLLFNHDRDAPLGVVRDLTVRDGRLYGELQFARSARADDIWPQVRDGFLSNMSIGYRVHRYEVDEGEEVRTATDWELLEASVVTIPADQGVGVGRSDDLSAAPGDGASPESRAAAHHERNEAMSDENIVDFENTRRQAHAEGALEGQRAERERIAGIRELFARERFQVPALSALCDDLVRTGVSVDAARQRLLDAVGSGVAPVAGERHDDDGAGRSHWSAGEDSLEKFERAASEAIDVRAGICRDDAVRSNIRGNELYSHNLVDLAREYLRRGGVPLNGLTKMDIVGQAFTRAFIPGQGVSSFANILGNTAEKAMMLGWDEADETWNVWTREGRLPDFKQADRVGMSGFGDLDEIPASGEFKQGAMSDLKETIKLATYGKIFNINRQAIINDDLMAFSEVPMKMGRAASRKVGNIVYDLLISNPTMNQDATALFHANHNNAVLSSGAAPSVSTLTAGFTAMATQTAPAPNADETGHRVNVRPSFALVPVALEISTRTLVTSTYDPAGTAGTLTPNPFANTLQVVADARLDADSATAWYLAARAQALETIEVAFLDGERRPFLDQQEGWNIDGVSYKVRMDAGASVLDFRGLYKNVGA